MEGQIYLSFTFNLSESNWSQGLYGNKTTNSDSFFVRQEWGINMFEQII